MRIIKSRDININYLLLSQRKNTKIGTLRPFLYENAEFAIQCSPVKVVQIKSDMIIVEPDSELYEVMSQIQDKAMNSCSTPFEPFMNTEILLKITKDTLAFNKDKKEIPKSSLEAGNTIIPLLETKGVWEDKKSSTLAWNIRQFIIL